MNRNIYISIGIFFLVCVFLLLSVKGQKGNPIYYQIERDIAVGGPFESSNSTSRYALVEAIVENNTFFFNEEQARFSGGDLVYFGGKFFSVFTPGVSLVSVPFYILGKAVGYPQLLTYLSTTLFAFISIFLVTVIAKKLGANIYESFIGGMLFVFGTNALSYAQTLTQHHISTFLILLALLLSVSKRKFINNILLGAIFGIGILVDIPNAFMMLPIILYVFYKSFDVSESGEKMKISLKLNIIGFLIGVLPFLSGFVLYNYATTGSYTKLSQSIGRVDFNDKGAIQKRATENSGDSLYEHGQVYDPRNQLNGLYILLISNERGWLYYSPIVVIGILGLILAYKKKENKTLIVLGSSIAFVCVLSYSMFGDPWGGWSFGPRYLIPATAVVCSGIGIAIAKFNKNPLFILIFFLLTAYSVSVNSLGAMTTSAIPPKVEALNLQTPIPYTYEYNLKFVEQNRSSSLVYNLWFYRYSSLQQFLIVFIASELTLIAVLYILSLSKVREVTS